MVNIVLNDKKVMANPDKTILQVAKENGIDIPNLCYLEGCSDITSCRVCVVEVVGARNLVPACSSKVAEGMVIYTHSDKVVAARKDLLELILADHPLDCMTCEKAGVCKLQDYCYEYEVKDSPYRVYKEPKAIDDSNQFYTFDPNKCIKCRKCVKVCSELQCTNAIGFSQRGSEIHVTPPSELPLGSSSCVSCGNCVANCPVGALMPKAPEKFRSWEVQKVRSTCAYCGVGCQLNFLVKDNRIVGVEPYNGPSNKGLLCVKGRFGYHFVGHKDRLTKPLMKKDGQFVEISWEEAYKTIADKINEIKAEHGPDVFGGFSSSRCSNEENYLFQKFMRGVIGTNNVDNCARL